MSEDVLFKFEFLVKERHVTAMLKACAGIALEMKTPTPVVLPSSGALNGTLTGAFVEYLVKSRINVADSRIARDFLKSVGKSPQSASYLLRNTAKTGRLKQQGKGSKTVYAVVGVK